MLQAERQNPQAQARRLKLENRQRLPEGIRFWVNQRHVALPFEISLAVGVQLIEVCLAQSVLVFAVAAFVIKQLPFCVQHQTVFS